MNANNPNHFRNNVIDLLVLEVGSYFIRIRQVLGHFGPLETLNLLTKNLQEAEPLQIWRRTRLYLHDDEMKVNLYPGLMCQSIKYLAWVNAESYVVPTKWGLGQGGNPLYKAK